MRCIGKRFTPGLIKAQLILEDMSAVKSQYFIIQKQLMQEILFIKHKGITLSVIPLINHF